MGRRTPVSELTYCSDDQVKPCVVSFGVDADDNMLVNILVPNISYPDYYLKITRNGTDETSIYKCLRIRSSPNSTYCIGAKMPPGETLHLLLISTKDDTLLAEGELSIVALAFPTLDVSTSTPEATLTPPSVSPTPTDLTFPVPTKPQPPSPTRTPSYPNPPYP